MLWNSIKIPFTIQDSIVAPVRSVATFYVYISNKEVETGIVPGFHLGKGIYAGDAVATNCDRKAYIRVINTRNTDAKIVIPRVERLKKIATSGLEINLRDYNISNCAVYREQLQSNQSSACYTRIITPRPS